MVGSLIPCKASCEPSTLRCLPATCVLSQMCHCPRQSGEPQGLNTSTVLWKAEGKQNRSESGFSFLDCSLPGMAREHLWFSAFKKKLVPICFIDMSYCKSDSFSAY